VDRAARGSSCFFFPLHDVNCPPRRYPHSISGRRPGEGTLTMCRSPGSLQTQTANFRTLPNDGTSRRKATPSLPRSLPPSLLVPYIYLPPRTAVYDYLLLLLPAAGRAVSSVDFQLLGFVCIWPPLDMLLDFWRYQNRPLFQSAQPGFGRRLAGAFPRSWRLSQTSAKSPSLSEERRSDRVKAIYFPKISLSTPGSPQ